LGAFRKDYWGFEKSTKGADFGLAFSGKYGIMLCLLGRKIVERIFSANKEGAAI
jgi:hypothetical protein